MQSIYLVVGHFIATNQDEVKAFSTRADAEKILSISSELVGIWYSSFRIEELSLYSSLEEYQEEYEKRIV